MTPEDLYWQDTLSAMTQDTLTFYEEKFRKEEELVHPMLEMYAGDSRKVMAHRLSSAWKRVKEYMKWEHFVEYTTNQIWAEQMEESDPQNLTEVVLWRLDLLMEDLGIEVSKLRNGMRIKSKEATPEVRNAVMEQIIKNHLLDTPTVEEIKLKLNLLLVS